MAKKGIPAYYGFRIYLTSSILYFFLVIPFLIFIALQNIPKFSESGNLHINQAAVALDSLGEGIEPGVPVSQEDIDSLVARAQVLGESLLDSLPAYGQGDSVLVAGGPGQENGYSLLSNEGPFPRYFLMLFLMIVFSNLAGFLYNRPFKQYFRRKRKKAPIGQHTFSYAKKYLLSTPLVNSIIVTIPNVVVIIYSLVSIIAHKRYQGEVERDLFIQFFYLTLVAALLEFLFVYYWQKHRVHIKYIDHLYSETELRKQVFRRKGGKIRNRLLLASGMTTFLPLVVVMVYLILSLTSLKDLKMENISPEQKEILLGNWASIIHAGKDSLEGKTYEKLFYVNAIDSIIMLVGIGTGIMVSFLYILLFIKWTNQDITGPVKELLTSIRNTRGGDIGQYTVVRTNDEIGELAEGYNEMTAKIYNYVESISQMNRDLEATVKERTNEVVLQKEEIEAQKEEIEAQLDLTTAQRDTIMRQKEQILDSIRYAERIQSAILPPVEHLSESLTDHFILFKPRDIVSGDYYWTTRQGDRLMIAVADCTGHGVPGAFLSMLGISSMNEIVRRNNAIKANEILEKLRDFVIKSLHQTGSRGETRDGIEIALGVIDTRKKILQFAGANRPLYMIRRKEKDSPGTGKGKKQTGEELFEENATHRLLHVRADKMPIGIYDQEPIPFTNHELRLGIGDSIYLFSDGYVDQLGGPSRKTFRSKHFRKLLLDIQDHPMEEQKRILAERLDSWRGNVEQIDDILVIGIKI